MTCSLNNAIGINQQDNLQCEAQKTYTFERYCLLDDGICLSFNKSFMYENYLDL